MRMNFAPKCEKACNVVITTYSVIIAAKKNDQQNNQLIVLQISHFIIILFPH